MNKTSLGLFQVVKNIVFGLVSGAVLGYLQYFGLSLIQAGIILGVAALIIFLFILLFKSIRGKTIQSNFDEEEMKMSIHNDYLMRVIFAIPALIAYVAIIEIYDVY